jgi:epoxyqueuosine reductase
MNDYKDKTISELIKLKASDLGFDLCGIAPSRPLKEREKVLSDWCSSGMNAGMSYLSRDIFKRLDPQFLVPGAKSLIVTGLGYYTDKLQTEPGVPIISRYAYGLSYQDVIKKKLYKLLAYIRNIRPEADGRPFSDSAPLLEKAWAIEAGLGWQGKHSVVINKKIGSFFFIGALILNIELEYDEPQKKDYCGKCRLCIDECPTAAINEDKTIDARKCIANLTIEDRDPIPEDIIPKIGKRIYGCDKCQEVCPWNRDAKPHKTPEFDLSAELQKMSADQWLNLTREQFDKLFKDSPVERRKYEPFMRNILAVIKTSN